MRLRTRSNAAQARTIYKLLSILLRYPDQRLFEAEEEIAGAIEELPMSKQREALDRFWQYWLGLTTTERAQRYVETFDFQKRCGLYLSFYLQGDRRQRGMILLRLKHLYAAAGLLAESQELPDYLPLVLEFAALAPDGYGETILNELRPALEVVWNGLRELDSPYVHLLDALRSALPRLTPLEAERIRRIIADGPPSERVGLEPFAPPEVMPATGARR